MPEWPRRPLRRPRQCQALSPFLHRQRWQPAKTARRPPEIRRQPDVRRDFLQAVRPPPSTTTETFGPSRVPIPVLAMHARIISASAVGSTISSGSSPASAPVWTGTPVRTAISSRSTAAANWGPSLRTGRATAILPRAVTSITPLPCMLRCFAEPDELLRRQARLRRGSAARAVRRRSTSARRGQGRRRAA